MTRNGKIARLPRALRQELNQRLQEGEPGKQLVDWLNSLPKVKALMKTRFEGRPISESNLSEWKTGGFRSWEADQQAAAAAASLMEGSEELRKAAKDGLTDRLVFFLTARMAIEIRRLDSVEDGPEKARILRELRSSVLALRRTELHVQKLNLEWEKYNGQVRKEEEEERRRLEESNRPKMTPEEKQARINQIMGVD
jgi:hypothetical protein